MIDSTTGHARMTHQARPQLFPHTGNNCALSVASSSSGQRLYCEIVIGTPAPIRLASQAIARVLTRMQP